VRAPEAHGADTGRFLRAIQNVAKAIGSADTIHFRRDGHVPSTLNEMAFTAANHAVELKGLKTACCGIQRHAEANMIVHLEPLSKLGRTDVLSNVFSEVGFQITAFSSKKLKFLINCSR